MSLSAQQRLLITMITAMGYIPALWLIVTILRLAAGEPVPSLTIFTLPEMLSITILCGILSGIGIILVPPCKAATTLSLLCGANSAGVIFLATFALMSLSAGLHLMQGLETAVFISAPALISGFIGGLCVTQLAQRTA